MKSSTRIQRYEKPFFGNLFFRCFRRPLAACMILFFAIWCFSPLALAGSWQIQTVDSGNWSGRQSSITVDNSGNTHIAYSILDGVKYAVINGSTWDTQIVDTTFGCNYPSIALDMSGNPKISYESYSGVKYAAWDGSAWQTQTIYSLKDTGSGILGAPTTLALDDSGKPHISFYDSTDYYLKYASWNGSAWQIQNVAYSGGLSYSYISASLALDASGNPRIAYTDGVSLNYASSNGSGWQIQSIDNNGIDSIPSLVLDRSGNPHISYNSYADNAGLNYAVWHGTDWDIQTVDNKGWAGSWSSLSLDNLGNPCICYIYQDLAKHAIKYASWDGSAWQIQTIDEAGEVGLSLALDSSGNPHISYHNDANESLEYAVFVPEPSTISLLAIGIAAFFILSAKTQRRISRSNT